jgi:hypothetical protein
MSLCSSRFARAARCGERAVAGVHQQRRQCAGRPGVRLPDRAAVARRRAGHGDGLYQQLSVVRYRRPESAWLGVCSAPQFSVSRQQCPADDLWRDDRPACRDLLDQPVLGQLLSRPALVQPAEPLVAPSAATTAAPGRGASTGRRVSGRTSAGTAARQCRWTSAGWAAAG